MASNFFSSLAPSILTSPLPPPPLPHGIQLQPLGRFPSLGPLRWRRRRRRRGEAVVTNAGPPSSTSLLIAFVLPLSLIAGTVFASIRVADALDEKYLEEVHCHCPRPPSVILSDPLRSSRKIFLTLAVSALLQLAMTKAVSEENEDEEGDGTVGEIVTDGEGNIVLGEEEEEVAAAAAAAANAVPRVRNRPRRRS
ncbi:uncharacterized protein M6B38_306690 [Iris pallida]|uniref:Uncharacterized protein n=1 Tax=Iris pallida TaxID=29817 RepID=A0AAX6HLN4_IRIPA|nr:uncharacterized protein M6B38_306690 [Iris pallida]